MSTDMLLNQSDGETVTPCGYIRDFGAVWSWVGRLPDGQYKTLRALNEQAVDDPAKLEAELLEAFLAVEPEEDERADVEALLLAVLGRDPAAEQVGSSDFVFNKDEDDSEDNQRPKTITERALKVTPEIWNSWSEEQRRREYLLVLLADAMMQDEDEEDERDSTIAAICQLLRECSSD
jgi:hypothetical protein